MATRSVKVMALPKAPKVKVPAVKSSLPKIPSFKQPKVPTIKYTGLMKAASPQAFGGGVSSYAKNLKLI